MLHWQSLLCSKWHSFHLHAFFKACWMLGAKLMLKTCTWILNVSFTSLSDHLTNTFHVFRRANVKQMRSRTKECLGFFFFTVFCQGPLFLGCLEISLCFSLCDFVPIAFTRNCVSVRKSPMILFAIVGAKARYSVTHDVCRIHTDTWRLDTEGRDGECLIFPSRLNRSF